jgi:hypothetical protein
MKISLGKPMPWIVEMCTHVAPKLNASSWLVHFHENHHENHQKNLLQWIQHDEAYFSQQNARLGAVLGLEPMIPMGGWASSFAKSWVIHS